MPGNKSAMKRLRTSEKDRVRHKAKKSALKTFEKKLRAAVDEKDKDAADQLLKTIYGKLDKAVKSGTIHRNKSKRKKSQLGSLVADLSKASS